MGGARIKIGDSYARIDGPGIRPCRVCGVVAEYRCDFPLGPAHRCDVDLCEEHAITQGRFPSGQLWLAFPLEAIPEPRRMHYGPFHDRQANPGPGPGLVDPGVRR